MSEQPWLVTTCVFKGNQFLVKMNTNGGSSLELSIVDKHSGEEWSSQYDSKFIENLTLKTGNYKRFDIFIRMLKSGLLRTSECVSLDLLTFEALELLRGKKKDKNGCKIDSPPSSRGTAMTASANRRYLILTYTVEFDRIHYPLPMEYIGPPNPQVLQATIRKLEAEVQRLRSRLSERKEGSNVDHSKSRIKHLEAENWILQEEVAHLRQLLSRRSPIDSSSVTAGTNIPEALKSLEEQVKRERTSFRATLLGLQEQNHRLRRELDELNNIPKDPQEPETVNVVWKRRGRSPADFCTRVPPKENAGSKLHPPSRNEVWPSRLNRPNLEAARQNPLSGDRRSRVECVGKNSDSDFRSRSKSPNVVKPHPQTGIRPRAIGKGQQRHVAPKSSRERTSSSSDCSSVRGRTQVRKPGGKQSRSSSQGSSCSTSSSLSSSSVPKRDRECWRRAQGDMGYLNPPKLTSSALQRAQSQRRQHPHKKAPWKTSQGGATSRMSDLETRIKALQSMLKDGLSLP